MATKYFSHSPRGFANEVTIYAVDGDKATEWAEWFNAAHQQTAYAATALNPITRRQAERMLRRDGALLHTHEDDAEYLHGERLNDRINPESVTSACRAALAYREEWEKERAFERDMAAQYPEFA